MGASIILEIKGVSGRVVAEVGGLGGAAVLKNGQEAVAPAAAGLRRVDGGGFLTRWRWSGLVVAEFGVVEGAGEEANGEFEAGVEVEGVVIHGGEKNAEKVSNEAKEKVVRICVK